jgi:GNAT superfamily N-acetyltransferase
MSAPRFKVSPLNNEWDRTQFNCGSEPLNRYFREQVTQDMRRRVASCFVAIDDELNIAAYYTLAAASILLKDLPDNAIKKLPRYPTIPAVRMGRLAVDNTLKGQGLGGALLADALIRASNSEIAAYALMVEAKDESTSDFYSHHGFISLPDSPLTLFLPLSTVWKISHKIMRGVKHLLGKRQFLCTPANLLSAMAQCLAAKALSAGLIFSRIAIPLGEQLIWARIQKRRFATYQLRH